MIEVYFDGSNKPLEGIATYGHVIKKSGKTIMSDCGLIGKGKGMTHNVAEYSAVKSALTWIKKQNFQGKIVVRGDSKLVINQLLGEWKIKSATSKKFVPEIRKLAEGLDIKFEWVPREENKEADELSKKAYESSYRK